jgi:NADPH:quinone reductase-like Zn-dependent oxidoreductase
MQHLVLTHFGKPEDSLHLAESPDPVPGAGKVLVRIAAAAIHPSDLMLIEGQYLVRPPLPAGVGAEGVGVVEAVGPGVDHRVVGKRVIVLCFPRMNTELVFARLATRNRFHSRLFGVSGG